jgi:hypothetical protein
MCGRYDLNESPQMLMRYFHLPAELAALANADVRPANRGSIIYVDQGQSGAPLAGADSILGEGRADGFSSRNQLIAERFGAAVQ